MADLERWAVIRPEGATRDSTIRRRVHGGHQVELRTIRRWGFKHRRADIVPVLAVLAWRDPLEGVAQERLDPTAFGTVCLGLACSALRLYFSLGSSLGFGVLFALVLGFGPHRVDDEMWPLSDVFFVSI